jgi:hypothetical protein
MLHMPSFETQAGRLDLPIVPDFYNADFGYSLWEGVMDPANPEGPRALAMHLPVHAMSKVWQLVEPGYHETVELLAGSANLAVYQAEDRAWTTTPLTAMNPTGGAVEIGYRDLFCMVATGYGAYVLSRPSREFDISFEQGVTRGPEDKLSRFILDQVAAA